jgi:cytochrome c biogenesis protein
MSKPKFSETASSESVSILFEIKFFFTSVRTTIFLLFAIAIGAIFGTVIPQGESLDRIAIFGNPFLFRLAVIMDLNNVFRSWWFVTLLSLLTLNIFGCLFQRIPLLLKEYRGDNTKMSFLFHFSSSLGAAELTDQLLNFGRAVMGSSAQVTESSGMIKYKWNRQKVHLLGFPFIHVGIIVILLGGLIGSLWGFKGHTLISEGESSHKFTLVPSEETRNLPFSITVDNFTLLKYPTGEPREFRSDIRLSKDGKDIKTGSIRVNHPLTYEGISLFQADYRVLGVKSVKLSFKSRDGELEERIVDPHRQIEVPGSQTKLKIMSLNPGTIAKGPGIQVNVIRESQEPEPLSIYEKDAKPLDVDGTEIRFLGFTPLYATGLQIGYDPGVLVVWLGCSLLVLGFILTLFTNLQRLSVEIKSSKGATGVVVSGRSRKLRREFRERVEQELAKLADLKPQDRYNL